MTLAIARIAWQAGKEVLIRLLDGVDPEDLKEVKETAGSQEGVIAVGPGARWLGHRLHAEVNLTLPADSTRLEKSGLLGDEALFDGVGR